MPGASVKPPPLPFYLAPLRVTPGELALDLLAFGFRQARACVFAGAFFVILYIAGRFPIQGLARYDAILLGALAIQALLIALRLESRDELLTLGLFHVLGFVLEVFKTHPSIGSWSYPEPGGLRLLSVPLYSGFMYAAVASYIVQAWRLLNLRLDRYPAHGLSIALAVAIYVNFFTHHFFFDARIGLALLTLALFWKTRVVFRPRHREYSMPLPLSFALIGAFLWIAENISTLLGAWSYPHQHQGWKVVGLGKISSWSLLVIVSFIIVADLKHVKARLDDGRPAA